MGFPRSEELRKERRSNLDWLKKDLIWQVKRLCDDVPRLGPAVLRAVYFDGIVDGYDSADDIECLFVWPFAIHDVRCGLSIDLVSALEQISNRVLLEAKGREFPVVILVDLPDMDKDHEHNFMHVAITRAKAKLFVICGPERMATLRKIADGEA